MVDEGAKALLREIRDLLSSLIDLEKRREEKYDKHLEDMRQIYIEHTKQYDEHAKRYDEQSKQPKQSQWKEMLFTCIVFFLVIAFGVFIGVLTGLRFATDS